MFVPSFEEYLSCQVDAMIEILFTRKVGAFQEIRVLSINVWFLLLLLLLLLLCVGALVFFFVLGFCFVLGFFFFSSFHLCVL